MRWWLAVVAAVVVLVSFSAPGLAQGSVQHIRDSGVDVRSALVAQIVGVLGYVIYIGSSQFTQRPTILLVEGIGCIVIAIHWWLLGEMITVFTNLIALYSACLGVLLVRFPQMAVMQGLGYPLLGGAAYLSFDGSLPFYIAVAASSVLLTAKCFKDLQKLRVLSTASGILWTIYGIAVLSVPATLFGLFFSLGHASKLLESWRGSGERMLGNRRKSKKIVAAVQQAGGSHRLAGSSFGCSVD